MDNVININLENAESREYIRERERLLQFMLLSLYMHHLLPASYLACWVQIS